MIRKLLATAAALLMGASTAMAQVPNFAEAVDKLWKGLTSTSQPKSSFAQAMQTAEKTGRMAIVQENVGRRTTQSTLDSFVKSAQAAEQRAIVQGAGLKMDAVHSMTSTKVSLAKDGIGRTMAFESGITVKQFNTQKAMDLFYQKYGLGQAPKLGANQAGLVVMKGNLQPGADFAATLSRGADGKSALSITETAGRQTAFTAYNKVGVKTYLVDGKIGSLSSVTRTAQAGTRALNKFSGMVVSPVTQAVATKGVWKGLKKMVGLGPKVPVPAALKPFAGTIRASTWASFAAPVAGQFTRNYMRAAISGDKDALATAANQMGTTEGAISSTNLMTGNMAAAMATPALMTRLGNLPKGSIVGRMGGGGAMGIGMLGLMAFSQGMTVHSAYQTGGKEYGDAMARYATVNMATMAPAIIGQMAVRVKLYPLILLHLGTKPPYGTIAAVGLIGVTELLMAMGSYELSDALMGLIGEKAPVHPAIAQQQAAAQGPTPEQIRAAREEVRANIRKFIEDVLARKASTGSVDEDAYLIATGYLANGRSTGYPDVDREIRGIVAGSEPYGFKPEYAMIRATWDVAIGNNVADRELDQIIAFIAAQAPQ